MTLRDPNEEDEEVSSLSRLKSLQEVGRLILIDATLTSSLVSGLEGQHKDWKADGPGENEIYRRKGE